MHSVLLSSAYLAPLEYYSLLKNYDIIFIEQHEHFVKQTFRSRCEIYSPNGKQVLSIPLIKRNHKQTMKEIKISYDYDWQRLHWRSMESAYRRSPFFEFYEDELYPFYHEKKMNYLIDLNEEMQQLMLSLMKLKINNSFTTEYKTNCENADDFRNGDAFIPPEIKTYNQVFETRHGFIPNLSIVDLLFNQGPRALDYI